MSANENHQPLTFGLAGQTTRSGDLVIEPKMVADPAPGGYGLAVSLTADGKVTHVSASSAIMIYGFMAGSYPRENVNPVSGKTDNVMRRGYMAVPVGAGDPTPGAPVFIRVQNPSEGKPIGGPEAVADGVDTIEAENAMFESTLDADGMAEISFGIVTG